jgi:hypothetical protein
LWDFLLLVPTRLNVERTSSRISVTIDNRNFLQWTNIVAQSGEVTGQAYELYVYPTGLSRPLKPTPYYGYGGGLDFNLGTHYLNTSRDGIPITGKSYVVDMDLAVFETAPTNFSDGIPRISTMSNNKLYHILWRGRLEQLVK